MGYFGKFTEADDQNLPKLTGGRYLLKVTGMKEVTSKRPETAGRVYLITTAKVIESDGEGATPEGAEIGIPLQINAPGPQLAAAKALVCAVCRLNPHTTTAAQFEEVEDLYTSDDGQAVFESEDHMLFVQAEERTSKNGFAYTAYAFRQE